MRRDTRKYRVNHDRLIRKNWNHLFARLLSSKRIYTLETVPNATSPTAQRRRPARVPDFYFIFASFSLPNSSVYLCSIYGLCAVHRTNIIARLRSSNSFLQSSFLIRKLGKISFTFSSFFFSSPRLPPSLPVYPFFSPLTFLHRRTLIFRRSYATRLVRLLENRCVCNGDGKIGHKSLVPSVNTNSIWRDQVPEHISECMSRKRSSNKHFQYGIFWNIGAEECDKVE